MVEFNLDGRGVAVPDDGANLLEALRDLLGCRAPKDGCSPQGQCGCCTVLVDGAARVACVTPLRRVSGRQVTTLDGVEEATRRRFADAFSACGASQCGFCTPGIIMRLVALEQRRPEALGDPDAVAGALSAHLCRCTGWRTIIEAAAAAGTPGGPRALPDPLRSAWRGALEGGNPQSLGPAEALGTAGFADDRAPRQAAVAVPCGAGRWSLAATRHQARQQAGRPPGRRSTAALRYPLALPEGHWELCLRTTWVEPAYLEPDASWCQPGGQPASPLANGGAFGGKAHSPVPEAARHLSQEHRQAVRALWSREDVVRLGPKRPPLAVGLTAEGTGRMAVATTPGSPDLAPWVAAVHSVLPEVAVEVVEVEGPPVSCDLRAAGWAEAQVLQAALGWLGGTQRPSGPTTDQQVVAGFAQVQHPGGGRAAVTIWGNHSVSVEVWAGELLDATTVRSYVIGAVHQGLGWVFQEAIAVDDQGAPLDLTIRSFGILSARQMPPVHVRLHPQDTWPAPVSDAVFAATAAAAWIAEGLVPAWPTRRGAPRGNKAPHRPLRTDHLGATERSVS